MDIPDGLSTGGTQLWIDITSVHDDLDTVQIVQLLEACRTKDRLDRLDMILRGDIDTWATLIFSGRDQAYDLKVDHALAQANNTASLFKQLLASLRLPDLQTGKRPQRRGSARAASPNMVNSAGLVSSLDRARAAKSS